MKFVSTRGGSDPVTFSSAMETGLAPDGGLYVPESFPLEDLSRLDASGAFPDFARDVIAPYFEDDVLEPFLGEITRAAFDFPVPLRRLDETTQLLELFHGPTAAFKDVGARFLAECVDRRSTSGTRTVLVATSGDTGGAVAAAFHGKADIEVFVLYPKGKISARQEKQIACWGGNVRAVAVRGTFDDCQRIVKEALRDREFSSRRRFVSANSINVARLLAQVTYYAKASLESWQETSEPPDFVVPTGNLGNAFAALWAKRIGFPIGRVVLATNANRTIAEFFATGTYTPRPSVATLANAMDVGDPSNMERLRWLYPDPQALRDDVSVVVVSDDEIREAIRIAASKSGEAWCPHTATAFVAREKVEGGPWILVATAHPAKFETIVEPLVGRTLEVPPALQALLGRSSSSDEIDPTLFALQRLENAHR